MHLTTSLSLLLQGTVEGPSLCLPIYRLWQPWQPWQLLSPWIRESFPSSNFCHALQNSHLSWSLIFHSISSPEIPHLCLDSLYWEFLTSWLRGSEVTLSFCPLPLRLSAYFPPHAGSLNPDCQDPGIQQPCQAPRRRHPMDFRSLTSASSLYLQCLTGHFHWENLASFRNLHLQNDGQRFNWHR